MTAQSTADPARQRILDAAEEEFARTGFDAAPTARIAESAGVPKGLVFYYFPRKLDLLRALLAERLPQPPLGDPEQLAKPGDVPASLQRLAKHMDLGAHESTVLRSIIFREVDTHPEVRDRVVELRAALIELTERVLDAASPVPIPARKRRQAAHTFVAVLMDEANARRYDGLVPDVNSAARLIAAGLLAECG